MLNLFRTTSHLTLMKKSILFSLFISIIAVACSLDKPTEKSFADTISPDTLTKKMVANTIATDTTKKKSEEGQDFPEQMPKDFKISYLYAGGMGRTHKIELSTGTCSDIVEKMDEDNHSYTYKLTAEHLKKFGELYVKLKKMKAFSLRMEEGWEESYPGESIKYTINGKMYIVAMFAEKGIIEEDREAFRNSAKMIIDFAGKAYTK